MAKITFEIETSEDITDRDDTLREIEKMMAYYFNVGADYMITVTGMEPADFTIEHSANGGNRVEF